MMQFFSLRGLLFVVCGVLLIGAITSPDPNPEPPVPVRPEFTDLSVGVLLNTATSGSLLSDPVKFGALFIQPWMAFLDSNNAMLNMSVPDAMWDGPKPPTSVKWQCAAPIRQAWNLADADVKMALINAFKQYHSLVWSGGDASPLPVSCMILGMSEPLTDPGDAFTEVTVKKIPDAGPVSVFQIILTYD